MPNEFDAKQTFQLSAEIELDSTREGVLIGRASTRSLNSYGFKVGPLAFNDSILAAPKSGAKAIKFLLHHDSEKPFGKILSLMYDEQDNNMLLIEVQLFLEIQQAREFYIAAKNLGGLSFSVGFKVIETLKETVDGKDLYTIVKGNLIEVSGVTFPSDPGAIMTEVLSEGTFEIKKLSDFEKYLVDSGFCQTRKRAGQLSELIKKNLQVFEKREPVLETICEEDQPGLADEDTEMALLAATLANLTTAKLNLTN